MKTNSLQELNPLTLSEVIFIYIEVSFIIDIFITIFKLNEQILVIIQSQDVRIYPGSLLMAMINKNTANYNKLLNVILNTILLF